MFRINIADIAKRYGLTAQAVSNFMKNHNIPSTIDGLFLVLAYYNVKEALRDAEDL